MKSNVERKLATFVGRSLALSYYRPGDRAYESLYAMWTSCSLSTDSDVAPVIKMRERQLILTAEFESEDQRNGFFRIAISINCSLLGSHRQLDRFFFLNKKRGYPSMKSRS
jgi:hypothetical protein